MSVTLIDNLFSVFDIYCFYIFVSTSIISSVLVKHCSSFSVSDGLIKRILCTIDLCVFTYGVFN